jgi:pantetheine-phosphate adenylyltransferase
VKALYPGSFDPITLCHLDLIERSSKLFRSVIVLVAVNSEKQYLFSVDKRIELIENSIQHLDNVKVDSFSGLTVNYAKKQNATTIIRGLRAVSDFEKELQMAQINYSLNQNIETLFLATASEYSFLSSSVVKEVAKFGGSVEHLVPLTVAKALREHYQSRGELL